MVGDGGGEGALAQVMGSLKAKSPPPLHQLPLGQCGNGQCVEAAARATVCGAGTGWGRGELSVVLKTIPGGNWLQSCGSNYVASSGSVFGGREGSRWES